MNDNGNIMNLKRKRHKFIRENWLVATKSIATIIAVIIALSGLVKGLSEYSNQGAQQRAEHFLEMRHRFKDSEKFQRIAYLLYENKDALYQLTLGEKVDYVGFFEEIALLTNSDFIKPKVAHYMFGYYAIECWENEKFWRGMSRESKYWSLFRDFEQQMKTIETDFRYQRDDFKF